MLERNREDLQRQLAAADTQLSVMEARLCDANMEVEGLQQRMALEQGRYVLVVGLNAMQCTVGALAKQLEVHLCCS